MANRKLTHEEFLNRVLQNNKHYVNGNIEIVGQYVGSNKPIACHCNIHNSDWDFTPNELYMGHGCRDCYIESLSKRFRYTHEEFIEKLLLKNKYFANGDFELVEQYICSDNKIKCKCKKCGHEWDAPPSNLLKGYGCHQCRISNEQKFYQDEFLKQLKEVHNNKVIALDYYINMYTKIRFQCDNGHIWFAEPHNVVRGHGCPYCAGKALLVGFNDLWTARPDIAALLKNPEDGYKYVKSSKVRVDFICPCCGSIINKRINDIYNHGFVCPICSDGISYPNKFARSLLNQLPIQNHICEYHPNWAKSYFYDNYFEYKNKKYILEMDGGFHYKDVPSYNKSSKDAQATDRIKTELANQNDISVIRIDCQKSDCNYIKSNILSSELSSIFDLSNIDWGLCDKMSQKNFVKQACDLYMSGVDNLKEIANMLNIDRTTVLRYLKTGAKYGWCNYDAKKSIKESVKYRSNSTPIILVDDNSNILQEFYSIHDCQNKMKEQYGISLWRQKIPEVCKTHEPYHGFNFRFASEFNNNN